MSGNESLKLTVNDVKEIISPRNNTPNIRLQKRDYEILQFILDQKFASLEVIYFRFFDTRMNESDPLPKNFWTVRQRLSKLRFHALIKTEKVLSSGRAHFLLTPLGAVLLGEYLGEPPTIKPTKKIDFSAYEHDIRVSMIRSFIEKRNKSKTWYSEKWLKSNELHIKGHGGHKFSKDLRPDAVFINSKGERVALELEFTRKGSRRLCEKIQVYEGLLNSHGFFSRARVIHKVWIVVTRPSIYRDYKKAIEAVGFSSHLYRVDLYDDVIPGCAR